MMKAIQPSDDNLENPRNPKATIRLNIHPSLWEDDDTNSETSEAARLPPLINT